MKKILFTSLNGYPSESTGGPTKIIYELLKNLDYTKYRAYYLSYDMFREYSSLDDLNVDQSELIHPIRRLGKYLFNNYPFYKTIVQSELYLDYHFKKRDKYFYRFIAKNYEIDIIHSHDSLSSYYFRDFQCRRKILTIHTKGTMTSEFSEVKVQSRLVNNLYTEYLERERLSFRNYDLITFPSYAAKELFITSAELHEIDPEKIKIIYNGVNEIKIRLIESENVLEKLNINTNNYDVTILNVAQHVSPKNIYLIIEAVYELKKKYNINALLVNVGNGYLTNNLTQLIAELHLQENVKLLGLVPNDEVIRLMKSLDIFIQASENVVFDLVVLEAINTGIKVLVSNEGGNKEVIKHGENGWFISRLDKEDIARDIVDCMKSEKCIGKQIDDMFNVSYMSNNYFELY